VYTPYTSAGISFIAHNADGLVALDLRNMLVWTIAVDT